MTYIEYSLSLKKQNYDKSLINEETKKLIDDMIEKNISIDVITQITGLTDYLIKDYYHNEWCYKNPERYFHSTWVMWVNTYVKKENHKTK